MEKAKVYFTKEITEESLVKIYEKLGIEYLLKDAKLPTDEEIKRAENLIGAKRN